MNRPRASTSNCGATCGTWCAACAQRGVTIILTTHYIEEAEEMADRVGVINKGGLILVEDKEALMKKLGKKQLTLHLKEPMHAHSRRAAPWGLELKTDGEDLVLTVEGTGGIRHLRRCSAHERAVDRDQGSADASELT